MRLKVLFAVLVMGLVVFVFGPTIRAYFYQTGSSNAPFGYNYGWGYGYRQVTLPPFLGGGIDYQYGYGELNVIAGLS